MAYLFFFTKSCILPLPPQYLEIQFYIQYVENKSKGIDSIYNTIQNSLFFRHLEQLEFFLIFSRSFISLSNPSKSSYFIKVIHLIRCCFENIACNVNCISVTALIGTLAIEHCLTYIISYFSFRILIFLHILRFV